MNWTEGNLARHSRGKSAKDDVLKRQKQYFARARTRFLNGVNPSPGVLPFPESRHDRSSGHWNPFGRGGGPRVAKRQRDDPIYHGRGGAAGMPFGNDGVLLHDITKTPPQAPTEDLPGEVDSQQKRRKLLGKTDWAGLSMQQPLELTFPGVRQPGQLWGKHGGPRKPSQARVRHSHAADQQYPGITPGGKHRRSSSPRIRVQIGSQHMSHGTDSVSPISKKRGYSSLSKPPGSRRSRAGSVRRFEQLSSSSKEGCHDHYDHRKPSRWHSPEHRARLHPKIHEPVPLRAGHFPVLQWSPSRAQGSQSMVVETGRRAAKSHSQFADEEKWFKLADSPNEELIALTRGSSLLGCPSFCLTSSMPVWGGERCSSSLVSHGSQRSTASPTGYGPMNSPGLYGSFESVESEASIGASPGSHGVVQSPDVTVSQPRHALPTNSPNEGLKVQAPSGGNEEDEDQVWKSFISENEGDESRRHAFIEAARFAARCFGPSDSSTTSSSRLCSELLQTMTKKMETRVSAPDSDPESLGSSGNSNGPIYGHGMLLDLSTMSSNRSEPSEPPSLVGPHITPTLSQSETGASPVQPDGWISLRDPGSPSMVVSFDLDSTAATKASSSEDPGAKEIRQPFQFAIPCSFVGKLAETNKVVSVPLPQSKSGRGRGRRILKAEDGRMSIRSLPTFDDDPIEDTDED